MTALANRTARFIQIAQLGRFMVESITNLARYYYTPAFFKIDQFQNYRKRFLIENCHQLLLKKLIIKESSKKIDAKILTSDVKFLLYSACEQDLDFLISIIRKYKTQRNGDDFNYNFALPLLKLLHVLNHTDKALEIYLSDDNLFEYQYKVTLMLTNKLLEDRRYKDAIQVYDKFVDHFRKNPPKESNYFELFSIITEVLMEKNDQESLIKSKQIINDAVFFKSEINHADFIKVIILALEQKDPVFAYELTEKITKRSQHIIKNLKILALIKLNRFDEAILLAEETKRSLGKPNNPIFFQTTLEKLLESFENRSNEYTRIRKIIESATHDRNFSLYDLREYAKILNESRQEDHSDASLSKSNSSKSEKRFRLSKLTMKNQREFREDEFSTTP